MKAFFLDRDGVINDDSEAYVRRVEDVKLYEYVAEALKLIGNAGYEIFIVSNQSGVHDGKITMDELTVVNNTINEQLKAKGAPVPKKYFYCPHAMDGDCECRKPKAGLLFQAEKEFGVDLSQSFIIGDRISDMSAGYAAGCAKGVHVLSGYGMNVKDEPLPQGYLRAENLLQAVKLLLQK